jgi:hypothetical protein
MRSLSVNFRQGLSILDSVGVATLTRLFYPVIGDSIMGD